MVRYILLYCHLFDCNGEGALGSICHVINKIWVENCVLIRDFLCNLSDELIRCVFIFVGLDEGSWNSNNPPGSFDRGVGIAKVSPKFSGTDLLV